jgi:hypothetical protein
LLQADVVFFARGGVDVVNRLLYTVGRGEGGIVLLPQLLCRKTLKLLARALNGTLEAIKVLPPPQFCITAILHTTYINCTAHEGFLVYHNQPRTSTTLTPNKVYHSIVGHM